MKRLLAALFSTVTLALTVGFVPFASPAAAFEYEDVAIINAARTGLGSTTAAVVIGDDGFVYTGSNHAGTGELGIGAAAKSVTAAPERSILEAIAVHKVSPAGEQEWVWEIHRGEPVDKSQWPNGGLTDRKDSFGWIHDITVDDAGVVYGVGYWTKKGTTTDGVAVEASTSKTDGIVFAINPDGTTKWLNEFHSTGHAYLNAVDVDNNGNVVVAGKWTGIGRMMQNTEWSSAEHKAGLVDSGPGFKPFIAKLNANSGLTKWAYWWNVCLKDNSMLSDVAFLSDGSVVSIGGYSDKGETGASAGTVVYDSRSRTDCGASTITGAPAANGWMNDWLYGKTGGNRSNMVKLSADGDFMWGREWGSPSQINYAGELAVDPTNDDMYIAGLWTKYKEVDDHYFAPTIPSNNADFPNGTFTRPTPIPTLHPNSHEGCHSKKGAPFATCDTGSYQNTNADTYLLHVDKHGNYKDATSFDVHLVMERVPDIDINSDGSELVLTNTGYYAYNLHAKPAGARHGASGWVMTVDPADLTEKWTSIPDVNMYDRNTTSVGSKSATQIDDVRYGPDDLVYMAGRAYGQVNFGATVEGPASEFPFSKYTSRSTSNRADAIVVKYDADGNVAGGTPPVIPNEVPDGYSLVKGLMTQDDGDVYWVDYGGEAVWNTPLCTGGRWEVSPQPGVAVRQYMVNKADLAASSMTPGEFIRNNHNASDLMLPNYNILWQDGFQLDTTGFSSDPTSADQFKVVGWDDGVADLEITQQPVGFYFRNNTFTYNTNDDRIPYPRYMPTTEIDGHTWDLDEVDVYMSFAHPSGSTNPQPYPEFATVCPDPAGFTVTNDSLVTDEDGASQSFTVVLHSEPTGPVRFRVSNTDTTEVSVDKTTMTFYTYNWDVPQTVTVTGIGDGTPDGDITSYVNLDITWDNSSYEYADVVNQFVTVVNENVDLLPPPPNPDIDGDGILNVDEVDGCADKADCDGDGINDGNEIFACTLTPDCDGDGVPDNSESSPACIQDPSCKDIADNVESDPEPEVVDPEPVEPENPPAPDPPPVTDPIVEDKPQPEPQPDVVEPDPNQDTDNDGVPDNNEAPECVGFADCDGDGLLDGEDSEPENDDVDGDGLVDGFDPDTSNPDTDGDGIPDGEDDDADGNGTPDVEEPSLGDAGGLLPPDEPSDTPGDDTGGSTGGGTDDGEIQTPQPSPGVSSSDTGFIDAIGDLPPAAIAAAALVAAVGVAAAAASLAGPSLLSWLFRGVFGIWLFGLLFGRKGVRCDVCDLLLVKRDGVWVDKDTHWQTGINEHIHVPADFSDKDRAKYLNSLK